MIDIFKGDKFFWMENFLDLDPIEKENLLEPLLFHPTNAFIPTSIFRLRFNICYSSIRFCEGTSFSFSKELDVTYFIAPVS